MTMPACRVRPETPEDIPRIDHILRATFDRPHEALLVRRMREAPEFIPQLSLVALVGDVITGHVMLTHAPIVTPRGPVPALLVLPLAVGSQHQGIGVGTTLMEQALERSAALGHGIVLVVGEPRFYQRFGFVAATEHGIDAPFAASDFLFMAKALRRGSLEGAAGIVLLSPIYGEVAGAVENDS